MKLFPAPSWTASLPYEPELRRGPSSTRLGHPLIIPIPARNLKSPPSAASESLCRKHGRSLVYAAGLVRDPAMPRPRQVVKIHDWSIFKLLTAGPFKPSKSWRSFQAACLLQQAGLATPLPLAVMESRLWGFIREDIYICEELTCCGSLRDMLKDPGSSHKDIKTCLKSAAEYILAMHDLGIWHRDLNPGNFLVRARNDNLELWLIDLGRTRIKTDLSISCRARDLARMDLYGWHEYFFHHYCGSRYDPQDLMKMARQARIKRNLWRRAVSWSRPLRAKIRSFWV
ncbi:MAG: lipopolysaccharide kinase InaA family protein [Desulfonatronovibrionaceae bacterium]